MPTTVSISAPFQKELERLARKYPKVIDVTASLIETLKSDQRPGDKISRVGYDVYKVPLKNPSASRGKSGGFSDNPSFKKWLTDTVFAMTYT